MTHEKQNKQKRDLSIEILFFLCVGDRFTGWNLIRHGCRPYSAPRASTGLRGSLPSSFDFSLAACSDHLNYWTSSFLFPAASVVRLCGLHGPPRDWKVMGARGSMGRPPRRVWKTCSRTDAAVISSGDDTSRYRRTTYYSHCPTTHCHSLH